MKTINNYTFFWKDKIAQWNMTDFYYNGLKFNCAEQFMMYQKAILFKDQNKAFEILNEIDPKKIQELGREVKNFDIKIWELNRYEIVVLGNLLKFSQNPELLDILLSTNDTILVEASPYDLIWGVGLGVDDELILDSKNWKGLNLLGKVLMEVRDTLKKLKF